MKPRSILSLTASFTTIVLVAGLAPQAHAADLFWDADGDTTINIGGNGTWATASGGAWRIGSAEGTPQLYGSANPSSAVAQFAGTAGTVSISGTVTAAGLNFGTSNYFINDGTLNLNPASSPFVYTTSAGTSTINSTITSPGGTQITKTGPGTLQINTGGGGSGSNPALYTVTGGTLNASTGIFDSIFAMPAANRLGVQAVSPTVVLTLDAGTLQITTATGNALATNRKAQVNAAGGSIVDNGGNFYEPEIINNAGIGSSLYLTNGSGATEFRGPITGTGSVTWMGANSSNLVIFKGANTYTGKTTVNLGTLRLDFGTSNTGTSRLSSSSAVTLNSAALAVLGTSTAGQTTSQTINGLTVSGPFCTVANTSGAAGVSSTLALGGITRTALGTVTFTRPATGGITTTTPNTNGIIGAWATVDGTGWASNDGSGNLVPLSSYLTTTAAGNTAANYLSSSNVDVTSSPALSGPIDIQTLRFNTASATNLGLTGTNVLNAGGILVTPAVGANPSTISGGMITGTTGSELIVFQNNTSGTLTIGSQIVDSTNPAVLLKTGGGSLILNNSNLYTGGTRIGAGILGVAQNDALGSGDLTFAASAILQANASSVIVPNNIPLGTPGAIFDTNGNMLTLSGTVTTSGAINNAIKAAGTGTLVLAGTLNVTGSAGNTDNPALMMGNRNGANFNRGTTTITGTGNISRISTGWDNTANVLNIASSGTINMATDLVSGQSANGFGALNVSSGTINMQNLNMANWDGSNGSFTMTGGTINTSNIRNGGNGNNGSGLGLGNSYSRISGGTINVASTNTMSRNGNGTNVMHLAGADAQYNVGPGNLFLAYSGDSTGVLTMDAGTLTAQVTLQLANGNTPNTFGIVNLNGGVLNPNGIGAGSADGISIVNFDGGILKARLPNINFLGGLKQANIFDGGAKIDTNGATVTIAQALQPATGNGITSIPVTTGGSGYLGIPVVKITGGGGTGATAVAAVDGGVVTGIQVTSAGTGYTSAPTVTLTAAGALTLATVGTATIAANAPDGGLTVTGLGALALTGASTYTGTTTVTNGTLTTNLLAANGTASGLGAGTAVALDGGTLRYTGGSINNGFNRTITVGTNGGTLDNSAAGFVFYGGSLSGAGTLNVIDSSRNSRQWLLTGNSPDFSGDVIVGDGAIGSGMMQYRSDKQYPFGTGLIRVNGGGIVTADTGVTSPSILGNDFVLNGGFLGTQVPNMNYTGNVLLEDSSTLGHPYTNTPGTVTVSGVISGGGWAVLGISTATTVIFTNDNTYAGPTTVSKGTLQVNGSLTNESDVFVASAGTLAGTGTINRPVFAEGSIAPGAGGIGILNVGNTVLSGGVLKIELNATTCDQLNVTGDLDVTNATVLFTPLESPAAAKYVIAKYTGTLTGTLTSSSLPSGYALTHDTTAKEIYISDVGSGFSNYMDGFPDLSSADKLPGADPDGDGISNLLEYSLAGFDPTVANASPGTLEGNLLSYTKSALAVSTGVIYAIEESVTLGAAPSPWTVVTPLVNDGTTISYLLPSGRSKEFARLKVSEN